MTLESMCVSLELAKRLRELGVKQESMFWWVEDNGNSMLVEEDEVYSRSNDYRFHPEKNSSAFTASELGEIIGEKCCSFRTSKHWFAGMAHPEGTRVYTPSATTEAEARGLMLIYLIENHLITIDK